MRENVKITVMKRLLLQDMVDENAAHPWQPCGVLTEGQEFISEDCKMPEGFCSWAWADIHKYVVTLARGGNFLGSKPGRTVACCTDGYRPVIFKLERCGPTQG